MNKSIDRFDSYFLNNKPMALHLAYSWAKSLFQKSPINPQTDCYNLGDSCPLCNELIKPTICICVCKCEKYCHYKCILQKFQNLTLDNEKQMRCELCLEIIKIQYEMRKVFKPKLQLCLVVQFLIAFPILIQCLFILINTIISINNTANKISNQAFIAIIVSFIGLTVSCLWVIVLVKKIIWKKELKIKTIYPRPMELHSNIQNFNTNPQEQTKSQVIDDSQLRVVQKQRKQFIPEQAFSKIQIGL